MPKQGYCAAIFYNSDETIASVEILPTQEAKHLISAFKVEVEKRNFKVYRLGALLAKCVRDPVSGPTPAAPDSADAESERRFMAGVKLGLQNGLA